MAAVCFKVIEMSVKVMGLVWECQFDEPAHKLVLLAYADHADHNGKNVYPSIGLIAWKTGVSERQVQRITRTLIDQEYLLPVSSMGGGRGRTNRYRINIALLQKGVTMSPFQERVTSETERVTFETERVTSGTLKGDIAMSPEPSLTINKQTVINHDVDVLKLVAEVSGMVYIPPSEATRTEQLYRMVETYGYDATRDALKVAHQDWISRRRKDGSGTYRGVNMTWVDWAMETLAGNKPAEKDISEMSGKEFEEYILRKAAANAS